MHRIAHFHKVFVNVAGGTCIVLEALEALDYMKFVARIIQTLLAVDKYRFISWRRCMLWC